MPPRLVSVPCVNLRSLSRFVNTLSRSFIRAYACLTRRSSSPVAVVTALAPPSPLALHVHGPFRWLVLHVHGPSRWSRRGWGVGGWCFSICKCYRASPVGREIKLNNSLSVVLGGVVKITVGDASPLSDRLYLVFSFACLEILKLKRRHRWNTILSLRKATEGYREIWKNAGVRFASRSLASTASTPVSIHASKESIPHLDIFMRFVSLLVVSFPPILRFYTMRPYSRVPTSCYNILAYYLQ